MSQASKVTRKAGPLLAFIVPLMIGLGFGYLYQQYSQAARDQETATQFGSGVLALVEELRIVDGGSPAGSAGRLFGTKSEYCLATFRYSPPGTTSIVRKRVRLNSISMCKTRKAGDTVTARVVRGNDRIFLLEEDRIAFWWNWVFLSLFVAFSLLAMINLRALLGIRRPGSPSG